MNEGAPGHLISQHDVITGAGNVHYRQLASAGAESAPVLICLHPAPHSGAFFSTVMPQLNAQRVVLAPDYPGYGASAAPSEIPAIETYSRAVIDLIHAIQGDDAARFDLVGFHTGCLVAVETALRIPACIRHIVLIDVPYFTGAEQNESYQQSIPRVPPDRELWGFHAAYTYACEARFARLDAAVGVIATRSALLEPTRRAARLLRNCRLTERLDIGRPVFADPASGIAAEILVNLAD